MMRKLIHHIKNCFRLNGGGDSHPRTIKQSGSEKYARLHKSLNIRFTVLQH